MRSDTENQYLLAAVDSLKRSIIVVSKDFKILSANRHAAAKLGEGIIGKYCHQVYHARTSPCEDCPSRVVISEKKIIQKDANRSLIDTDQVICNPIIDPVGGVEAFVVTDFDVLHIGMIEEKLTRTNTLLENMLDSAVDAIIAADRSGRIFIFNEAAREITGYSEKEALTQFNIRDLYQDDLAYEVMRRLRSDAYGGKGKLKECQLEVLRKNGEKIPISLSASIIYEDGREVATIGFFHDLRHRLRISRELEKTQSQLYQAEKMASIGKLAAGVAHQINNPLGGITLFTKLILEEHELPEEVQQDLNRILKDAQRCRTTVKELLEFARQSKNDKKPMDLNRAIERTLFLVEGHAIFHNIQIQKDLSANVPFINGDEHQLGHVIMNIVFNAAQAMEGKGVLKIRTRRAQNSRVILEVADSGPGIPQEILPHIFEPFYTTKEEGKGTGLGLSLAYGIIADHGGAVSASNAPGGGAIFTIWLPIEDSTTDTTGNEGASSEPTA